MEGVEWPRTPEEVDRRRKLTTEQWISVVKEHNDGATMPYLAAKYGVSVSSIHLHVHPEKYREALSRNKAKIMEKYRTDPGFRAKMREQTRETAKHKRTVMKTEVRKYVNAITKVYNKTSKKRQEWLKKYQPKKWKNVTRDAEQLERIYAYHRKKRKEYRNDPIIGERVRAKGRENQQKLRDKIKADPILYAEHKRKARERHLKTKNKKALKK